MNLKFKQMIHSTRANGNKYGGIVKGLCCFGIRMTDKTEYYIYTLF